MATKVITLIISIIMRTPVDVWKCKHFSNSFIKKRNLSEVRVIFLV